MTSWRSASPCCEATAASEIGYWLEYHDAGYNYRLSDIQGAMGVAQMEKVPYILARKRELASHLTQAFEIYSWNPTSA